jgi:hypothetical protein
MCPGTLAIVGLVGAGVSAGSSILSGIATGNAANYQAQVAQNNAITEKQNAEYATEAGQAQAQAVSLKGAAAGGKVKAAQAANNVDVDTGSPVTVQQSERETNQLDTETVLNNAAVTTYGYRTQVTGYQAQSELEEKEAEEAPIGGYLSAGGNLLSSASSVGFKWGGGTGSSPFTGVSDTAIY